MLQQLKLLHPSNTLVILCGVMNTADATIQTIRLIYDPPKGHGISPCITMNHEMFWSMTQNKTLCRVLITALFCHILIKATMAKFHNLKIESNLCLIHIASYPKTFECFSLNILYSIQGKHIQRGTWQFEWSLNGNLAF